MTGNLPRTLTIASLLSILLMTLDLTDDILRNHWMARGGVASLVVVLGLAVWLYGTLMLAERRSGYVINLVFSFLASGIAAGHMTWVGDVGQIAYSSGAFFVWVVIALGVTAISSFILSAYGLWGLQRGRAR